MKNNVLAQLMTGFLAVIALLIGMGVFSLHQINAEDRHVAALRDNWLAAVQAVEEMRNHLSQIRLIEYRMIEAGTPEEMADADRRIDVVIGELRHISAAYTELSVAAQRSDVAAAVALLSQYLAEDERFRKSIAEGHRAEAREWLLTSARGVRDAAANRLDQLVKADQSGAAAEGSAADRSYRRSVILTVGVMLVSVTMAVGICAVIAWNLRRQLGGEPSAAAGIARAISNGDLRVAVPLNPGDRLSLMHSLSVMKSQLSAIVREIRQSSESVLVAASQIAEGNADLSERTEEQAASLQQTASSMAELASAVQASAANARQAAALAESGAQIAQRGGREIAEAVATMREATKRSAKVAQIIDVIEGIAFQTNILALNAAVEAARAGEQGRGFAVVASEVRSLAQRSASAAKQIIELVTESTSRLSAGATLIEDAGQTMQEIVKAAERTMNITGEIASSAQAQSRGIGEVDKAIAQMDQVTQRNAALVEQASAAAHELAEQADELLRSVAVFSFHDEEPPIGSMVKSISKEVAGARTQTADPVLAVPERERWSTAVAS